MKSKMQKGRVALVGAGPGDPGLMTIKGLERLREAEVVIYDNLCNPLILRDAPPRAEIIYAGKHSGIASITQEKIEKLMIQRAMSGKRVVRLKGGDPFVFGRGGEEAAALNKRGIRFEVIPGISSAIGVPAYAGIPVTHRDHSSAFTVVTAYEDPDKTDATLDYRTLARMPGTLVFLMGVKRLPLITETLTRLGKEPKTPAAVIRWGTRGLQQTVVGTLETIASRAEKAKLRPPSVLVVGDVVKCRESVKWFEKRPLLGKRILVTRTRQQASILSNRLLELGAEVMELPTLEIEAFKLTAKLRTIIQNIQGFDRIIFTSSWAAQSFFDLFFKIHDDLRALSHVKIVSIGPGTGWKLNEYRLKADFQPSLSSREGILKLARSKAAEWRGKNVLIPQSNLADDSLEKGLRKLGARVSSIVVYRNRIPKVDWQLQALEKTGLDIVTFASSSSVEHLLTLCKRKASPAVLKMIKTSKIFSIGPMTSKAVRLRGLKLHREARPYDLDGLIDALTRYS
jgi:uroporphyrinogen III methyltransferase / synthase